MDGKLYQYWKIPESEPFYPRTLLGVIQSPSITEADAKFKELTGLDATKDKSIVVTVEVKS